MTTINAVISGSFRKHLRQIIELRQTLIANKIDVLSPIGNYSINPGSEFVVLNTDVISDHQALQDSVFAKIRSSSMLVLANFDGYIGTAAAIEVGYAIASGVQIYSFEKVMDPNISPYTRMLNDIIPIRMNTVKNEASTSR